MVGKATLALVLATICAAPMLAAASGRSAGATRAARSRRYSASRYRGVPTFADSASDDVPTYDDPQVRQAALDALGRYNGTVVVAAERVQRGLAHLRIDRKSTRLNSSHVRISYAVFC